MHLHTVDSTLYELSDAAHGLVDEGGAQGVQGTGDLAYCGRGHSGSHCYVSGSDCPATETQRLPQESVTHAVTQGELSLQWKKKKQREWRQHTVHTVVVVNIENVM